MANLKTIFYEHSALIHNVHFCQTTFLTLSIDQTDKQQVSRRLLMEQVLDASRYKEKMNFLNGFEHLIITCTCADDAILCACVCLCVCVCVCMCA